MMLTICFLIFTLQALALGEDFCVKPSAPENGRVDCDEEPLVIGKRCHFECNEGYQLKGLTKRSCMDGLKWSGIPPKCISRSTFCSLPPNLIFGTVIGCSPTKLPRVGESCSFHCKDGYELQGPSRMICRSTGKYMDSNGDENFPECVEILSSDQNREAVFPSDGRTDGHIDARNHYETDVHKTDPCYNHTCEQLCRIEKGRAQCRCQRGFILNKEDQKTCDVNRGPPIHTTRRPTYATSRPTNPCNHNKGGCAQLCSLTKEREVFCSCRSGYVLEDDRRSCREVPQLAPLSPCAFNNGGCHHKCDVIEERIVKCSCNDGYTLHENGIHCIDINECSKRDLNVCEHECLNTEGSFKCSCNPGFSLKDGYRCEDIDECSFEHLNNCHHNCRNTWGSFTCSCRPGYILTDGYKCEGCSKNKFWSFELGGCVDCPENSHNPHEGSQSIDNCICDPGFFGSPGSGVPCSDLNECSLNDFGCSDTCNNIPGGAYCSCPHGFRLDNDNKTCIDIDECSIKNGGCEGMCINEHGSFHCTCPTGYKKSNKDQYSCDDVDECEENNGGCEQRCVNYRGGYHCACENGYRLDNGQKNCIEIECPALPVPPHSNMTCKHNKQKLQEMDNYPINTVCRFKCTKGFKKTNLDSMECQENGIWSGKLPQCDSQFCDPLEVPENGAVHPDSCSKHGNQVKQRCTFSCRPGYVISGLSIFQCRNELTWDIEKIPDCLPEKTQPRIECPEDVITVLSPGEKTQSITLSEPNTNMESYEVRPSQIPIGAPFEFQVGVTKVTFIASSSNSNKTARCITTVTVLDKEPPVFEFCPEHIEIEDASADGAFVTWVEPVATDNVGVELLDSILKPNTTLAPGTHVAEYIARDAAGNTASCSFDITINRMKCPDLNNPEYGEANCADWYHGKFCQPQCDDGYMRNPDDPDYYSCDDTGVWEPSDVITECLKFELLTSSTCPEGYELKINDETSENVCLQCSSKAVWSAVSKKCEAKK